MLLFRGTFGEGGDERRVVLAANEVAADEDDTVKWTLRVSRAAVAGGRGRGRGRGRRRGRGEDDESFDLGSQPSGKVGESYFLAPSRTDVDVIVLIPDTALKSPRGKVSLIRLFEMLVVDAIFVDELASWLRGTHGGKLDDRRRGFALNLRRRDGDLEHDIDDERVFVVAFCGVLVEQRVDGFGPFVSAVEQFASARFTRREREDPPDGATSDGAAGALARTTALRAARDRAAAVALFISTDGLKLVESDGVQTFEEHEKLTIHWSFRVCAADEGHGPNEAYSDRPRAMCVPCWRSPRGRLSAARSHPRRAPYRCTTSTPTIPAPPPIAD